MRKLYLASATIIAAVSLLALAMELVANGLYYSKRGKIYYFDVREPAKPGAFTAAQAVFHPYYSFIHRVGRDGDWWTTNNMGFQILTRLVKEQPGCCDYPLAKRDDEVLVGIFGGSAAGGFALAAQASPEFAAQLGKVPAWSGKRIRILNFAMPGFKQPQQLMTLAYFLSLGQRFDLVLNMDGFNEVVTSHSNWKAGAEPSFPADQLWGAWGRQIENATLALREGGSDAYLAAYYRSVSGRSKNRAERCRLAACYEFYGLLSTLAQSQADRLDARNRKSEEKVTLFPAGITSTLGPNFDVFEYAADQWGASSKAMADMLRSSGAIYLHVLQPNQWWARAGAYEPISKDHIYQWVIPLINTGYPKLASRVPGLRNSGVNILDATMLFREVPSRDVYIDDCCHLTDKGNALLGTRVAEEVQRLPPAKDVKRP